MKKHLYAILYDNDILRDTKNDLKNGKEITCGTEDGTFETENPTLHQNLSKTSRSEHFSEQTNSSSVHYRQLTRKSIQENDSNWNYF